MKRFLSIILLLGLTLISCAPAAVPAAEPVFYDGSQEDVFAAVVQAISTSEGIPGSNGWIIAESDTVGGFIRATTFAPATFFTAEKNEAISVVVSTNSNRTQVIIQGTRDARDLMNRVKTQLDQKFNQL